MRKIYRKTIKWIWMWKIFNPKVAKCLSECFCSRTKFQNEYGNRQLFQNASFLHLQPWNSESKNGSQNAFGVEQNFRMIVKNNSYFRMLPFFLPPVCSRYNALSHRYRTVWWADGGGRKAPKSWTRLGHRRSTTSSPGLTSTWAMWRMHWPVWIIPQSH